MKTSSLFLVYSFHLSFLHPYGLILVKNFTRNEIFDKIIFIMEYEKLHTYFKTRVVGGIFW